MSTQAFILNSKSKSLGALAEKSMADLGFTEPYDLETWLASCPDRLFGRTVLWLTRQDRVATDQRSDIIGIDSGGDLIVAELKRGEVDEGAIIQALAYAAEYERKTVDDLASLYFDHSQKAGTTALVKKATSLEDAQQRLSKHVGDNEVNQTQILIVLGEGFAAKALGICDYLNRSSGEASYSLEFWKYALYPLKSDTGDHVFLLEQVLPPPSIRQEIEDKREAAKAKKYARDRTRIEFMYQLVSYLSTKGITLSRSRGQSYSGSIDVNGHDVVFQVPRWESHPSMEIPDALEVSGDLATDGLTKRKDKDGVWSLEFSDVDAENLRFEQKFGDRLVQIVGKLRVVSAPAAPISDPAMAAAPKA
jgi:hypothetical protein